jgi:hypothetical protein
MDHTWYAVGLLERLFVPCSSHICLVAWYVKRSANLVPCSYDLQIGSQTSAISAHCWSRVLLIYLVVCMAIETKFELT